MQGLQKRKLLSRPNTKFNIFSSFNFTVTKLEAKQQIAQSQFYTTTFIIMTSVYLMVHSMQGILGNLLDFDEIWCVCSTYGVHHPY